MTASAPLLCAGVLLGLAVAAVIGLASARQALRRHLWHDPAGWRIARGIGTAQTHPLVRMALAPAYPLTDESAWYLFADHPRDPKPQWAALYGRGPLFRPLDGSVHYRIVGERGRLPADWWSVTVYDPGGMLPGPLGSSSLLDTGIEYAEDGSFVIDIAAARPAGSRNWLRVTPGPFLVALRIYGPARGLGLPRFEEAV